MAETKVDKSNSLETLEQQVDALLSDVQASLHDVESQMAAEAPRPAAKRAEPAAAEATPPATAEVVQTPDAESMPEAVDSLDSEMAAELSRTLEEAEKAVPAAEPVAEIVAEPAVEPDAHAAPIAVAPVIEQPVAAASADTSDAREVAEAAAALAAEVAKMIATSQPPEAPETTVEPDQTSLDAAVSEMVADATAAVAPETAKPKKEEPRVEKTAAASSVEDLDSQLASLTEQLLSEPTPEVSPHVPAAPHVPTPAPVAATAVPATAANAVAHDGAGKGGSGGAVAMLKSAPARLNVLTPIIVTILKPLSMPLNKQPRIVRDTLGWVAMITLFWALTIWAYLIFFHKPVESEAPENATHISTGEPAHGEGAHGKQSGKNISKAGEEDTARNLPAIRNVKQADAHKPAPTADAEPAAAHGER